MSVVPINPFEIEEEIYLDYRGERSKVQQSFLIIISVSCVTTINLCKKNCTRDFNMYEIFFVTTVYSTINEVIVKAKLAKRQGVTITDYGVIMDSSEAKASWYLLKKTAEQCISFCSGCSPSKWNNRDMSWRPATLSYYPVPPFAIAAHIQQANVLIPQANPLRQ